jgi:mono/diheme cytochrome c family protein
MKKTLGALVVLWLAAVVVGGSAARGPLSAAGPALDAQTAVGGSAPSGGSAARGSVRAAEPAQQGLGDGALLKQYCITCHNERAKQGQLVLEGRSLTDVGSHAEIWEKVVRKIRTGMMPPANMPRPDRAALDGFAAALEARLDRAADPAAPLATPALRRMNRTEYANAIRDLLALEINVAPLLPADASTEGFDNVAEALSNSPALIQGYVSAAMKISRLAVGDRTLAPAQVTYSAPAGFVQDRHIDGLPLGTRGGMRFSHFFPLDAEYEFTVGGGGGGRGGGGGADFTIDGQRVTAQNTGKFRIPVTAGPHVIGVATIDRQRGAGVDDAYSDFRATNNGFTNAGGVNNVAIMGPFNPKGTGDTPSRRLIFTCHPASATAGKPASAVDEEACARRLLTSLARRAYRGVVTDDDVATLMSFYQQGRKEGDFETGVQVALARILIAPRFIFRTESEPASTPAGGIYRISDVELASRLSFFLWSSIPDEELLELAAKNRLREPATLQNQVRRMLRDPKADALIENFAGQWLYLRELATLTTDAPGFNENLRQAFRKETELVFGGIVREDRSLVELLDSDYTYVDERLALHYGMKNVRGSHFRKVALDPASPRRGLLGHGSVLTVTSVGTRTSPVIRGKWILENLLGAPPPEPPPGVETNLDQDPKEQPKTVRQRLELHRSNAVCASCHNIIDPPGFALENFDPIGAWRDTDAGSAIDSTGKLADGTTLQGPSDLRQAVLGRADAFMTTATEKLLIYALGRPVHHYDMPTVRQIVRRAGREGNRFSTLVLGIVESDAFVKRVKK